MDSSASLALRVVSLLVTPKKRPPRASSSEVYGSPQSLALLVSISKTRRIFREGPVSGALCPLRAEVWRVSSSISLSRHSRFPSYGRTSFDIVLKLP